MYIPIWLIIIFVILFFISGNAESNEDYSDNDDYEDSEREWYRDY